MIRPLVAVEVWSDQAGTFYYNPELITDYQTAVEYYLRVHYGHYDHYSEFILFYEDTNLDEVLKDIEEHEFYHHDFDDYFDIEEAQEYFAVQEATYSDGTVAVLGDAVIVDSKDFSWGILKKQQFTGTVSLLDDPRYIQLKLDSFDRELRLPHYLVKKHE